MGQHKRLGASSVFYAAVLNCMSYHPFQPIMPGRRKEAQDHVLKFVEKIAGVANRQLYEKKFAQMSDEDFDRFVADIKDGKQFLSVVAPNFYKEVNLSVTNNLAVAKEMGVKFFHRIKMPAKNGVPSYLTPVYYLVVHLPTRRQAQLLEKKISIPEHNNSVDDMTGQPAGDSKGSKVSYPEVQVLAALGLNENLTEFMKYRGGDERGFIAMNTMIDRTGDVSLKAIERYAGGVKSTQTLKSYLAGMQLKAIGL